MPKPEEFCLIRHQIETGILLYLRDVHGIPFDRVKGIRFPPAGMPTDPAAVVEVEPKRADQPGLFDG